MFRRGITLFTICFFSTAVGLGVYTSNEHFNRMVLPAKPARIYHISEQQPGIVQVELLGEAFTVNKIAIKSRADSYIKMAEQRWQEVRSNPHIIRQTAAIKKNIREKWDLLTETEEIRAVNQWVKERI